MKKSTYITLFIIGAINWLFMAVASTESSGGSLWRLVSNVFLIYLIFYPIIRKTRRIRKKFALKLGEKIQNPTLHKVNKYGGYILLAIIIIVIIVALYLYENSLI